MELSAPPLPSTESFISAVQTQFSFLSEMQFNFHQQAKANAKAKSSGSLAERNE